MNGLDLDTRRTCAYCDHAAAYEALNGDDWDEVCECCFHDDVDPEDCEGKRP